MGAITFFKAIPLAPGSLLMSLVGLNTFVAALGCLVVFKSNSLRVVAGMLCTAATVGALGTLREGDSPRPTFGRCPPERPGGCFAQMGTVPFFRLPLGDKR